MPEPQSIHANEDTRLIPVWSIMAAAVVFLLVEYYFWIVFPQQQHHIPPLGLRIYMNLSWGLLAALYFLMIGFVSKDAPRRSMSSRFWMLICFVMPGGIGAVLVFSVAHSAGFDLRGLRHTCAERFPFLSAMQLSAHGKLWQLLPHGARHRSVLHAMRP